MTQQKESLLTAEVKAQIGQSTEVMEMHDTIDRETVRCLIHGIPDQDPRYWDEELAIPRYGSTTTPPLLATYVSGRKPPWEEDLMDDVKNGNWLDDGGGGLGRSEGGLPEVRSVAGTKSFLNAGEEVEMYRYAKEGDKIFYQSSYLNIEEKVGRSGPFLLTTSETRYWNQDNEVICIVRAFGIERP